MFKRIKNPTFKAPVILRVPGEDGPLEVRFTGRFRGLSISEAEDFDIARPDGLRAYIRAILIGWSDLEDEGKPVAFSAAALDALLDVPVTPMAIIRAYNDGMLDAKLGN